MSSAIFYKHLGAWTTTGMIELCLDEMLAIGTERHGSGHPVVRWLRERREGFGMGLCLELEGVPALAEAEGRRVLAALLRDATRKVYDSLGEPGKEWVDRDASALIVELEKG